MSVKQPQCGTQVEFAPDDPTHLLRQLIMALRAQFEEGLRPRGYTVPQFGVMMALKHNPGRSSAELARGAFVTPQAMGEVLAGLEKARLVRRRPSKGNARILLAELTPSGQKALDSCTEVVREINARMFAPMSSDSKKNFSKLLQLCLRGLQDSSPGAKI